MIRPSFPKRVKVLIIIGLLLTIFPFILESLIYNTSIFDKADNADSFLSKVLYYPLAIIVLGTFLLLPISYPVGTAILLSLAVLWFFSEQFSSDSNMKKCAYSALLLPISSNLYMSIQPLTFLIYPTGTGIRPMGWTAIMFVISITVTVVSLIWAIKRIMQNKKIIFGVMGIIISLLPLFTLLCSFRLIAKLKGLILKP